MRHRVKAKHFNRDTKGRKALFKGLLANLFEHGAIETTEPRAKELKRLADKLIHRALPGTVQARRLLERFFGSRSVVNNLVDSVVPALRDRVSGFTRIIPLGRRRGDDATMVKIELVNKPAAAVVAEEITTKTPAKKAAKSETAEVETIVSTEGEVIATTPAKAKKPAAKKTAAKPKTSKKTA